MLKHVNSRDEFYELIKEIIVISFKISKGSNRRFKPFWGSRGIFSDRADSIAHMGLHGATGTVIRPSLRRSSVLCQAGSLR